MLSWLTAIKVVVLRVRPVNEPGAGGPHLAVSVAILHRDALDEEPVRASVLRLDHQRLGPLHRADHIANRVAGSWWLSAATGARSRPSRTVSR
jgi:hypothetical protein